jgi:thioredoxin 1
MGAALQVTEKNFQETVEKGGIVLLDFWAAWCGPCRAFAPIFEKAAETHADLTFGKVNTDEEQQLSGMFEIRSIPTLMVFRDKVLLFAQPGALPAAALEDLIRQIRALDMDKVHREIAEQQKAAQKPPPSA